jgi:hypothetical protein
MEWKGKIFIMAIDFVNKRIGVGKIRRKNSAKLQGVVKTLFDSPRAILVFISLLLGIF